MKSGSIHWCTEPLKGKKKKGVEFIEEDNKGVLRESGHWVSSEVWKTSLMSGYMRARWSFGLDVSQNSTAAAKSLQLCPTQCDPIDGSPPGSPVPGILQARTPEWVAIYFSDAWKWKVKGKLLSRVWLVATPWTAAYQAPPPMGFSRQEYWSGVPLPLHCGGISQSWLIFQDTELRLSSTVRSFNTSSALFASQEIMFSDSRFVEGLRWNQGVSS